MQDESGTTSGDAPFVAEPDLTLAKNVIFMVPDGFGDLAATAYRAFKGGDAGPVWEDGRRALVETGSASRAVTDSAAAATAYATGVKTANGAVAVDLDGNPLISILDLASDAGKATGIVTTDVVAGATLAAFAASNVDRDNRDEIVQDYIDTGDLDVILGGGRESFLADPDGDGASSLREARAAGFEYVATRDELRAADGDRLLGLFNYGPLDLVIGGGRSEEPTLAEMAETALARLSEDDDGFFLVVEEAGTDIFGHANDAAAVMRSAAAYEDAVRIARTYAEANPDTLVISVADHETGGMTLEFDADRTPAVFRSFEATYAEMLIAVLDDIEDLGFDIDSDSIVDSFRATVAGLTGGAVSLTGDEIGAVLDARSVSDANAAFSAVMNARGGIKYTTTSHTAADVALHAFGAGADRFGGDVIDNTAVGRRLAEAMGLALPEEQLDGVTNFIEGAAEDDRLVGAGESDAIYGGGGDDRLVGFDGDDRLSGGKGDDLLSGRRGDDGLVGGAGDDRLSGGGGDDQLDGGAGSDTFIFRPNIGSDRIADLGDEDVLLFTDGALAGLDALRAASRQSGGDVLIALDDLNEIRIEGMTLDRLQQIASVFE